MRGPLWGAQFAAVHLAVDCALRQLSPVMVVHVG